MPPETPAFLHPPAHVGPPLPLHAPTNRAFQGIPSIAVTPGGRQWVTYYASPMPSEDHNCYVVLSTRGSDEDTWTEVLVVDPDREGPVRAFDPQVWLAPDHRVYLFWAQAFGHDGTVAGVWALPLMEPERADSSLGEPRRLTDGVMMGKPGVLSSGEWILPASTWRNTEASARLVISDDGGTTWSVRGGCHLPEKDRAYDEHLVVEKRDGNLWLLARTTYGIGESLSTDRGVTWPDLRPTSLAHPSARFYIGHLRSGNLLLVKHGKLHASTGRSHLTAYRSTDEGMSWSGGLLLDPRMGVSYPDAHEDDSGTVFVVYDYQRTGDRQILLACFREEDIREGSLVSPGGFLQKEIAKATGGWEEAET